MLCLTFDNFGCASTLPPCPFPDIIPVSEWDAYNKIGLEIGHPRILQLLEQLQIRTTYFAEGYAAVLHPTELLRWRDAGHEIGMHGWKHEDWGALRDEAEEDQLIGLAVEAMSEVLGERPIGFRPPGLHVNAWTDAVMDKHGLRYICQDPMGVTDPRLAKLGRRMPEPGTPPILSRHPILRCTMDLIDGHLIDAAHGGFFGAMDADAAFAHYFSLAESHEEKTPDEPWVFIVHPHISGNRAWFAFERFVRQLADRFGRAAFVTCREALQLA